MVSTVAPRWVPFIYVALKGLFVHDGTAWFAVLLEFFLKCIVMRSDGIGLVAGKSGASTWHVV